MNHAELLEMVRNDESSGVEFKRDDIHPEDPAAEIAALLNLEGGHVLLGVEDDRTVSGLTREPHKAEEWVMQVARDHIQPAVIPYWEVLEPIPGKSVAVVSLSANAPDKPYKAKRGSSWVTNDQTGDWLEDNGDGCVRSYVSELGGTGGRRPRSILGLIVRHEMRAHPTPPL